MELQQLQSELAHASRVSVTGQFASAIAHELSQPLGAILRNAEAAELYLEQDPPDLGEVRAILADIRLDDQRAGGVIKHLRTLLKRRNIERKAESMAAMLEDALGLTRFDAASRKVLLEIEVSSALPAVMCDAVHIQQVLLNLIVNAMDAVADAPVEKRQVLVRAQRLDEAEIEVAVVDAGCGIAPDKLGKLFDPFYTSKPTGLGVGLSISRTIIEAHDGRIWAENNAGGGATFRFTLPLCVEAVAS
jgi:C4-dicarboxylate-specific signal transduction histidine kinase